MYRAKFRKWYDKNPQSSTPIMTKYRQSHNECEWSYCEQIKPLQVHHILPRFKFPQYVDGDYHGGIENNFICYCPFHHFAYHHVYYTKRNVLNHKRAAQLVWTRVERWANNNKISFEDLEIELAQMLP